MCEQEVADYNIDDDHSHESGLTKQDLSQIDFSKLEVVSRQVMSRQAILNIGTIGHVAHGKSTVVKAMSGVRTTKYKKEQVMNITIHLGYANAKIFKCSQCPAPQCYHGFGSSQADETSCPACRAPMELVRHVSFVDCPGHDVLMATMLNGAAIMDAALLLIAANETFPQPQTLEHLKAVEIMRLRNIVVLQNKIDLVKETPAREQFQQISAYLNQTIGLSCPIIPISAQLGYNIDALLEYLCRLPIPIRELTLPMKMTIVRSFDVNKPSDDFETLRGGVAGGSIIQGVLKVGDIVEARPGLTHHHPGGQFSCQPIRTRVSTLQAEGNQLQFAIPGGLIAVGTTLDPSLTRQNKLVGQCLGQAGSLPDVFGEIEVQFVLFQQLVGAKSKAGKGDDSKNTAVRVGRLAVEETLQINVGTLTAGALVLKVTKEPNIAKLSLVCPVCCAVGEQIAISRRIDKTFRLIGWGTIRRGTPVPLDA